jgi:acyl-CoA synthetase (AMP-forming)/AMP-acid ligase II
MLMASKIGITLVPENMTLSPRQAVAAFQTTNVSTVFGWHSVVQDLKEAIQPDQYDLKLWLEVTGSGFLYPDSLQDESPTEPDKGVVSDTYILTMTSGSTGDPKPIELLQSTKLKRADATIATFGLESEDVVLAATPLYHSLAERLVIIPMLLGATLVLLPGFTAEEWVGAATRHKVTFTMAVSTQLKRIHGLLTESPLELPSLKALVSTSERLDEHLRSSLINLLQCRFYECYGTSEVACVTLISDQQNSEHPDSVGKALDYVEIKIVDSEGKELPTGETGEILCKTPLAFAGYFNKPDMTAAAMHDGFFMTGDVGWLDADGYLHYMGRIKDVVITGGISVYPKDIETLLVQHENILECAVIPLPDEALGEKVTAVVVLKDPVMKMRELQRLCARELADYQQPREYIVTEALPRNTMGKVLKQELVAKYTAGSN